jgi:hypothetical protein
MVQNDNSAIVVCELPYGPEEHRKFTQSKLITILDTTDEHKLKFKISNIDSLGGYFQGYPFELLKFKMDGDTLSLYSYDLSSYIEANENINWTHVDVVIKSQSFIKILQLNKKFVTKIDEKTVRIFHRSRQIKKNKGKTL